MSASNTLFDRTLSNIRTAWKGIASRRRDAGTLSLTPDLPEAEHSKLLITIRECLDGKGGEVSSRARAALLGEVYLGLSETGRAQFLKLLAHNFCVDHSSIGELSEGLCSDCPVDEKLAVEQSLRRKLSPPYLTLLTQFNALPQGVKFLVDMRADLLRCKRGDAHMEMMDEILRERLSIWFDIGFLELRRLTWDAPAALLERLIHYEAVHRIDSWKDLKNRLEDDRRCFAFFHPRMPNEPLIFVWVALVTELSDNIAELLDPESQQVDPQSASTAVFYSISNTQTGLQRVSLGNFLIKRVVDELLRELPQLKTFSTLSPIPGFVKWLNEQIAEKGDALLLETEQKTWQKQQPDMGFSEFLSAANWPDDPTTEIALEAPVVRLAAHYLVNEKRRNRAIDPVANFHLTNGAHVERINWRGDLSEKGQRDAHGLMVNYLYKLEDIEKNHEIYRESHQVTASKTVKSLADKSLSD